MTHGEGRTIATGAPWREGVSSSGAMPQIRIPVFQGPLDLLLVLIEHNDLDITAVSLVQVTDQYLGAVRRQDGLDANALAEFVAVGAKLIYLKSRALLPPTPTEPGIELEADQVGRELVDMLREYKRFGEAVDMLEGRQQQGLRFYTRRAPAPEVPPGTGLDAVTMDRLVAIMRDVLQKKQRTPAAPQGIVRRDTITLGQRIEDLRGRLLKAGRFSFRAVIEECGERIEVIIAFMAILELIKGGECEVRQSEAWGDIEVTQLAAVPA